MALDITLQPDLLQRIHSKFISPQPSNNPNNPSNNSSNSPSNNPMDKYTESSSEKEVKHNNDNKHNTNNENVFGSQYLKYMTHNSDNNVHVNATISEETNTLNDNNNNNNEHIQGIIIPVKASESAYLCTQRRHGLNSFIHEDVQPLKVVIQLLTATEGPFWKKIRGLGYAYGNSLYIDVQEGLLTFGIDRSTNLPKAFEAAKEIVTLITLITLIALS